MKSQTNEEIKLELINRILNLYNELITLDTELIDFLKNNFRLLELSDGDVLLERNMYATDFYFVGYGLLVGESIINGHKVINWFCGPNDSCTSISGMYGDFESKEKIYSHGRTFCLALDNTSIQLGYEKFPALNTLLRKMFEYYLKSSQQRADIIRLGTAKQRYYFYKNTYVSYAKCVPIELIANFLGVKTTTLALILKQEEKVFNKNTLFETKYNELIRLMEENQYFLNTDLNLTFLANKLDLNSHDLSEIINSFANKNFNEFINFYRIEYVKNRILKKNEWQHLKLEALGMEAGFKSRSSFFSVFKKYVGMSPLAYIEYVSS